MNNIRKILVPVDFSEISDTALHYISGLIKDSQKIEVTLLHICPPEQAITPSQEQKLSELAERWCQQIPSCQQRIDNGNVVDTIIKVQQEQDIDLIVMGTHGAREENQETITSKLVLEADCPVLVIPENQKDCDIKNIALALGENTIDNSGGLQTLHDIAREFNATVHILTINRNGGTPSVKPENQEVLEYYLESLLYFHAFPKNVDIEMGISDYIQEQNIDMLAILPRNHTQSTTPSEGRLTKLLTMHTKVPLLTID
jgi:nucleotide-binding universal stress UspA family protein